MGDNGTEQPTTSIRPKSIEGVWVVRRDERVEGRRERRLKE